MLQYASCVGIIFNKKEMIDTIISFLVFLIVIYYNECGDNMKRGFTIVELLTVIIILGAIALITFPKIQNSFYNSSEKLLEKQIQSIESVARTWGLTNISKLDGCYILTLEELKKSGLLENKDILNPKTKEELEGCVKIFYDESINQYTYTYTESHSCTC